MTPSRRIVLQGSAAFSALTAIGVSRADARAYDPALLAGAAEMWREVLYVNSAMGPSRLTGSPQHRAYIAYLKDQLQSILLPQGGSVFEEVFQNYPRWTANASSLMVGGRQVPVALYYPNCTGGFTGQRVPLVPATAVAAPGAGGGYPVADGTSTVIIPPVRSASGAMVDLGIFTGVGSVDWTQAAGRIAYIDYSLATAAALAPAAIYTVNGTYDRGRINQEGLSDPLTPSSSILLLPDIYNATKAGVLGVVLGWTGISDGNAQGQYNPFPAPYSSYPPSSQAGSSPTGTLGGIPAVWVNPTQGAAIRSAIAAGATQAAITVDARIDQVDTSTVWGILPGANYGSADDEFLICNTHTDGPNIAEENGGIGVFNAARYFAQIPRRARPKSMVFLTSTGHFSHGLLGSARDWIAQHPQIIAATAGVVTIEHLGCNEWADYPVDGQLVYSPSGKLQQSQIYVTAPDFQTVAPGPADATLLSIVEKSLNGSIDRDVALSGGLFFGEGGGFHAIGIPTIGYIPVPQYLCALADNGGIDKLDPVHFHSQVEVLVKCLLKMQSASRGALLG